MNFTGNRDNVVKRGNHNKSSRKGDLTTQSGTLGGYRLLQYLYKYIWFPAEYFINFPGFYDFRFYLEIAKIRSIGLIVINRKLGKFQEGPGIRTQVSIVKKRVFFKTNVNECSI